MRLVDRAFLRLTILVDEAAIAGEAVEVVHTVVATLAVNLLLPKHRSDLISVMAPGRVVAASRWRGGSEAFRRRASPRRASPLPTIAELAGSGALVAATCRLRAPPAARSLDLTGPLSSP
jgi:hypothetical protein